MLFEPKYNLTVYKLSLYKDKKLVAQTYDIDQDALKKVGKKFCREHNLDSYKIEIDKERSR